MSVDLVLEDTRWAEIDLETIAQRAEAATFQHLGLVSEDWEVSLLACDDARISALNGAFRNQQKPTNVLSWPSEDRSAAEDGVPPSLPDPERDPELGDIAISFDTCAREATQDGKSLSDHTTHLVVHGILHLLGYDHERDKDATLMEALEVKILGKMGLRDPY